MRLQESVPLASQPPASSMSLTQLEQGSHLAGTYNPLERQGAWREQWSCPVVFKAWHLVFRHTPEGGLAEGEACSSTAGGCMSSICG